MRKNALVLVLAAGLLGGMLILKHQQPAPPARPGPTPAAEPAPPAQPADAQGEAPPPAMEAAADGAAASPAEVPQNTIHGILASAEPETAKAEQLLGLLSRTSGEEQVEVAQHLCNLSSDEQFANVGAFLTNSQNPEPVLQVLMGDLLNRPEAVKLPLALSLISVEGHPLHGQAYDLLTLFLGQDNGTDWTAWQQAIDARLAQAAQPEEP